MKPILETIDTCYGTDNLLAFHMAIPYSYTGAIIWYELLLYLSTSYRRSWFNPDSPYFPRHPSGPTNPAL